MSNKENNMKKWTTEEISDFINKVMNGTIADKEYRQKALNNELPYEIIGYFASTEQGQDDPRRRWFSKGLLQQKNYQILEKQAQYMLCAGIATIATAVAAFLTIIINVCKH